MALALERSKRYAATPAGDPRRWASIAGSATTCAESTGSPEVIIQAYADPGAVVPEEARPVVIDGGQRVRAIGS